MSVVAPVTECVVFTERASRSIAVTLPSTKRARPRRAERIGCAMCRGSTEPLDTSGSIGVNNRKLSRFTSVTSSAERRRERVSARATPSPAKPPPRTTIRVMLPAPPGQCESRRKADGERSEAESTAQRRAARRRRNVGHEAELGSRTGLRARNGHCEDLRDVETLAVRRLRDLLAAAETVGDDQCRLVRLAHFGPQQPFSACDR